MENGKKSILKIFLIFIYIIKFPATLLGILVTSTGMKEGYSAYGF
jgi:hypothetical protein